MKRIYNIIGISIALIIIVVLTPFTLQENHLPVIPSGYTCNQTGFLPDGSYCIYDDFSDTSIISLLVLLLPIIAIISIIVYSYRPKDNKDTVS